MGLLQIDDQEAGWGTLDLGLVSVAQVPLVWKVFLAILQEQGKEWLETVSEDEVLAQIASGHWDLWLAGDDGVLEGYIVCGWERYARKTRYHILAIAGDGLEKYWKKGLERIEMYACLKGADEMVMEGRKGWKRLLLKEGYVEKTVRMVKPVKTLWRH